MIVSGTNGKTTTASIIRHVLRSQGFHVIGNEAGANLRQGVATALLDPQDADIAVLEIDEAALGALAIDLQPHVVVFTNIFRDQLDRYGEVETVARLLADAAQMSRADATIVFNADDPLLTYSLRSVGRSRVAFGLRSGEDAGRRAEAGGEPEVCPRCGRGLSYRAHTLAHLGTWSCACGLEPPATVFRAKVVADSGFEGIDLRMGRKTVRLEAGGLHNAYNASAAVAALVILGIPLEDAVAPLANFSPRFGRAERIEVDGHEVNVALIKNPAGADAVIREVEHDPHTGAVVVSINDGDADGHDPSWIWDADFETLARLGIPLVASGRRAADVAVRLKHGARSPCAVEVDPLTALRAAIKAAGAKRVIVLANYTAMLDVRASLTGRRESLEDVR